MTIFPTWVWPVPGLLVLVFARSRAPARGYRLAVWAVGLMWLAFILVFTEEVRSLARSVFRNSPATAPTLRVITFNTALGLGNAEDLKQYTPDLVLLQESPGPGPVGKMAHELFGDQAGVLVGTDTAILARGSVEPVPLPIRQRLYFVQARVRLKAGPEIGVVSLHLATPPVRVDLWAPSAWRNLRAHRLLQRDQVRAVVDHLSALPGDVPVIVGGDFNSPQGDAIFRLFEPRLRDAFREAGFGWGNTHENRVPVLRIDELWISQHFGVSGVRAHKTLRSDHRLVVADLWLK